jgi:hypothetical protein
MGTAFRPRPHTGGIWKLKRLAAAFFNHIALQDTLEKCGEQGDKPAGRTICPRLVLFNFLKVAGRNRPVGTSFKIGIQVVNAVDHDFVVFERVHSPAAVDQDSMELFFSQGFKAVKQIRVAHIALGIGFVAASAR